MPDWTFEEALEAEVAYWAKFVRGDELPTFDNGVQPPEQGSLQAKILARVAEAAKKKRARMAQFVPQFEDALRLHLGKHNQEAWSDYNPQGALRRACEDAFESPKDYDDGIFPWKTRTRLSAEGWPEVRQGERGTWTDLPRAAKKEVDDGQR